VCVLDIAVQDQVAVIKRRTELLLPGSKCFLVRWPTAISCIARSSRLSITSRAWQDIDDLQEIGDLAKYVAASQCVLVFLSKGCMPCKIKPETARLHIA
jgi:hypothetical protein